LLAACRHPTSCLTLTLLMIRAAHDRTAYPIKPISRFPRVLAVTFLFAVAIHWPTSHAQQSTTTTLHTSAPLTADEVVHNLVAMNLQRVRMLQAFRGTRIYRAEYHGIGSRSAEMLVTVNYLSPSTKEFTVQSATGSKLIIDKVFAKLLEAEKEAMDAEAQRRSALTTDNYRFTLAGYEVSAKGAMYTLDVEPKTKDKFLYRGRIWVDAKDFAVVRLEGRPAKNPSFWTKNTEIVQVYSKVGDFWLPANNRSASTIRLGGHADLSIEYKDYEVTRALNVDAFRSGSNSKIRKPVDR